jgi:tetratricopeptide (TPR) repeat protein
MIPLTGDRWLKLEALFLAAVDLPLEEREGFITRETGGDSALAAELAGMLAHHAGGGARIAAAIDAVARELTPVSAWVGRYCGPYRIVREIGRGGMGLVFEAVRDDDEYRKTVALKIAPPWTDAAMVRERFRFERQILAELEHPNIARFLDGGTADGAPYFVMEYVDGLPISTFCERNALDLRARITMFRKVCAAVHFAHESLIVHRDLKPSNILVTDDGTPKLLDFGIAKLLDPIGTGASTATADARWTPDYASPEQLRGRSATTRTDVYSLGLILYELLSGGRGQIADSSSPIALERSICETEPAPPSVRAAERHGRGWAQRLRGDLDTIVMTAIRKEPERRYGTAAALSDDLGRFLDGLPVVARPSTAMYRAGKFLWRHRVGSVAAALVLSSLSVGLGAALFEARRAERRFQQVRSLANTFVFDVHDRIESLPGSTDARKAIVQTALVYLESLRQDAGNDPALARELAAAYLKVGTAQGVPLRANLGDPAGAIASFARAQELLDPLAARGDNDARRRLVSILLNLATIRDGQGKTAERNAALSRAAQIGESLLATNSADTELLSQLSDVYASISRAAVNAATFPAAEQSARRSLALTERLLDLAPANREYRDNMASADNALGQTLHLSGNLTDAIDLFQSGIRIREQLVAEDPNNSEFRRKLLVSYGNLGDVLGYQPGRNVGDLPGAAAAFEKAAALAEWARSKDPHDRRAPFDLVNARLRLGSIEADDPRTADLGLRHLEDAERIDQQLAAEDPGSNRYRTLAVSIGLKIGETLGTLGRTNAAIQRLESVRAEAVALADGPFKQNSVVFATLHLAEQEAGANNQNAVPLADEVAQQLAAMPLANPFGDALARGELGRLYVQLAELSASGDREALDRKAARSLEDGLEHWRTAKLAAAVDRQRAKEIAALEASLADLKSPRPRHRS